MLCLRFHQRQGSSGCNQPRRGCFSLLEVILAMAIFFGSAAVLSQLLLLAVRSARWGESMTEATFRCESKIAQLASGAAPLAAREAVPFADDEDWHYSVEIAPTRVPFLVRVTLTVVHQDGEKRDVEVSLARLFADPEALRRQQVVGPSATVPPVPLSVEEMLGLAEEAP